MSKSRNPNPHFEHIDRAPYELGYLLRQLPPNLSTYSELNEDTRQIIEAAADHASNAKYTVIHGLEAIGNLMFTAGANEDNELERITISNLGLLIAHLAADAQFLEETDANLRHVLHVQGERKRQLAEKGENNAADQ